MTTRLMFVAMSVMSLLNLAVLAANLSTGSQAKVAGKDWMDLKFDLDFKMAVESIIEDCSVDGESISC